MTTAVKAPPEISQETALELLTLLKLTTYKLTLSNLNNRNKNCSLALAECQRAIDKAERKTNG